MVTGADTREFKDNNWLYNGIPEWTIFHDSLQSNMVFFIEYVGYFANYGNVAEPKHALALRPTFYLKASTLYKEGTGTEGSPYRLQV